MKIIGVWDGVEKATVQARLTAPMQLGTLFFGSGWKLLVTSVRFMKTKSKLDR